MIGCPEIPGLFRRWQNIHTQVTGIKHGSSLIAQRQPMPHDLQVLAALPLDFAPFGRARGRWHCTFAQRPPTRDLAISKARHA
jgi:hypothetical protein